MVRKSTGRTLYVLDEPTTGLHFADIKRLLAVLHGFVDAGNSVLVIEHNLDVLKTADWIIDLGPEGGAHGGKVIAEGTPEEVAQCTNSYTGAALREVLGETPKRRNAERKSNKAKTQGGNGGTNAVSRETEDGRVGGLGRWGRVLRLRWVDGAHSNEDHICLTIA